MINALEHSSVYLKRREFQLDYISSCDPEVINHFLRKNCLRKTLIIIASKSFKTQETILVGKYFVKKLLENY